MLSRTKNQPTSIHIIALTTPETEKLVAADTAGVGVLLEKPMDILVLLDTMRRLLVAPVEVRIFRAATNLYRPKRL